MSGRGKEMAEHKRFTLTTDVAVYYFDPQCAWQRGSNENPNGLLLQYLPKGTNLAVHSRKRLDESRGSNQRPRAGNGRGNLTFGDRNSAAILPLFCPPCPMMNA